MATLRYLATGASYQDLKFLTRISAQALSNIIPEFQWEQNAMRPASHVEAI